MKVFYIYICWMRIKALYISRVGWGWRYPESGVGWVPAGVPGEFEEESWRGEGKYWIHDIDWYNGYYPPEMMRALFNKTSHPVNFLWNSSCNYRNLRIWLISTNIAFQTNFATAIWKFLWDNFVLAPRGLQKCKK